MTAIMQHDLHLRQTEAFIAQNPMTVWLTRRARSADGAGGYTYGAPFAAGSPTMRLVGFTGQRGGNAQRVDERGSIVTITHILIGMPEVQVFPNDQFSVMRDDGTSILYEVLTVNRNPPWRVECEVFQHA